MAGRGVLLSQGRAGDLGPEPRDESGLEQSKVTFRMQEAMQATVAPRRVMATSFFYRPISARRLTSQRATRKPWSNPLMSEVRKCTPSQTRALMTSSVIVFQSA